MHQTGGQWHVEVLEGKNGAVSLDLIRPLPVVTNREQIRGGGHGQIFKTCHFPDHDRHTGQTIRKAVEKWLRRLPLVPCMTATDQGKQFTSKSWRTTSEALQIVFATISSHNPESNSLERVMKEIGRVLQAFCYYRQNKWRKILKHLEL